MPVQYAWGKLGKSCLRLMHVRRTATLYPKRNSGVVYPEAEGGVPV